MIQRRLGSRNSKVSAAWTAAILAAALFTQEARSQDMGLDLAAEEANPDTLLVQRLVIYPDGTDELEIAGSQYVTLDDGTEHWIDLDELEDPDGNKYMMVGDAYQSEEDGPVIYEARLQRFTPKMATDDEIRELYIAAHPEANEADVNAFMERRELAQLPQVRPHFVDPELEEWLDSADVDETIELVLFFTEQTPIELPRLDNALLDDEPAAWMVLHEERLLAIETGMTHLYSYQDDFLDDYLDLGVSDVRNYWIFNGVRAFFSRDAADALLVDERLQRIEVAHEVQPAAGNTGKEILEASQLMQFLDAGFDGHRESYRSGPAIEDIYGLIYDTSINQEHQAWNDDSGPDSRLISVYQDKGSGLEPSTYTTTRNRDNLHGTQVAGQFAADLTDDQDPTYSTPLHQLRRTGTTTETVFTFVMMGDSDVPAAAQLAKARNVDIVNMSIGTDDEDDFCDANHTEAIAVNSMMHDGIFVVVSAGNENVDFPGVCNVGPSASASGAFAVAAYDVRDADLNSASIEGFSSRGGDVNGRPIVHITAASGREGYHSVGYEDEYAQAMGRGTSLSAPIIAGAAADLKDFLIDRYGVSVANHVGLIHANMLVMGDGEIEDPPQTPATPIDPLWGVGRVRMRMFNEVGMDYPWRYRWAYWIHDHEELYELPINYNHTTHLNDSVPAHVDWFRAGLWFHEPNLGSGVTTSQVSLAIKKDGAPTTYTCASTAPQSQRLWLGENVLPGSAWTVKVGGLHVPASLDPEDPLYLTAKRRMSLAIYFEDRRRNDEEGPEEDIL